MALPWAASYRYGWMQVGWVQDRLLFYGWQLQDQLGTADPLGLAPSVPIGQADPAYAIRANDVAESGTTADLEVAFRTTTAALGVSSYRVLLFPNRRTYALSLSDALSVPASGYTSIPGDSLNPLLSFGSGLLDAELNPVVQDSTYRVVVLSMPDSIDATAPSMVLGSSIQLRVRAKAPSAITVSDSLNLGTSESFFFEFEAPEDESTVAGYWCVLEHGPDRYVNPFTLTFSAPEFIGLSAEDVFELPPSRRFFVPASGLSSYSGFLPAGLLDHRGASIASIKSYRLVVASEPDSVASFYGFADQSPWMLNTLEARRVQNLDGDADRNHEDGRVLRARFEPALDTNGIGEYRLYAGTGLKTIPELLALPSSAYVRVEPDGSALYEVDWLGINDTDGAPVTVDQAYRIHALSVGDSLLWNGVILSDVLPSMTGSTTFCRPNAPVASWEGLTADPTGLHFVQSLPVDSVGIEALRLAFLPATAPLLSESAMAGLPVGRFVDYTVSDHTWPIDSFLPAGITDAFGDPLLNGTAYFLQSQFIPDGIDASVQKVSIGSVVVTSVDTLRAVQNLMASDVGGSGTGEDLLIAFDAPISTTGVNLYRVFVGPPSDAVSTVEAEGPIAGRFIDLVAGMPSYATTAGSIVQTDGTPIEGEASFRVTVFSIDFAGKAASVATTLVALSDDDLRAQDLLWTDVADFEDARDVSVSFTAPTLGALITDYQVVLLPNHPLYSDAEVLGTSALASTFVPGGSSGYAFELPASLPDRAGALMAFDSSYQIGVVSKVAVSSGTRSVLARSPFVFSYADEWPASGLSANVLGDSIEIRFDAAPNESFLQEYRLIFSNIGDPLSLAEAYFVGPFGHHVLPLQGPGSHAFRFPRSIRDKDGQLINDGLPRLVYLLSYASTTSGALIQSVSPLTVPVGLSPPANPSFSLATGPDHWLLSADQPMEARKHQERSRPRSTTGRPPTWKLLNGLSAFYPARPTTSNSARPATYPAQAMPQSAPILPAPAAMEPGTFWKTFSIRTPSLATIMR